MFHKPSYVLLTPSFDFPIFYTISVADLKLGLNFPSLPDYLNTIVEIELSVYCLVSTNRSDMLRQTCSVQLQVILSMCDLLADTSHLEISETDIRNVTECWKFRIFHRETPVSQPLF